MFSSLTLFNKLLLSLLAVMARARKALRHFQQRGPRNLVEIKRYEQRAVA